MCVYVCVCVYVRGGLSLIKVEECVARFLLIINCELIQVIGLTGVTPAVEARIAEDGFRLVVTAWVPSVCPRLVWRGN